PVELPVEPVLPAFGPEVDVLLLGEPDAPPWPPALVPDPVPVPPAPPCAKTPPHASAAAAERARILKVCLMHYSCCVCVGCLRQGRRVSTPGFGNGCAIGTAGDGRVGESLHSRCADRSRAGPAPPSVATE